MGGEGGPLGAEGGLRHTEGTGSNPVVRGPPASVKHGFRFEVDALKYTRKDKG